MSTNTILATTPLVSTNYLLRATGTTIGNSLIWDNGTNVGIGNTNTSYTLDVSGTLRNTTSAYFATSSGSVGIGTTNTNNVKLEVSATTKTGAEYSAYTTDTGGGVSSKYSFWRNYSGSSSSAFRACYISNYNQDDSYSGTNSQYLVFATKSGTSEPVTQMTITGAGNVGIGKTPNTWNTVYKTLQIGASMSLLQDGSSVSSYWGGNLYVGTDGNYKYTLTGTAGLFGLEGNSLVLYNAASGTADTTASITERFRITSGGDVYINQTGADGGEGKLRVTQTGSYWGTEFRHTYSTQYWCLFRYNSTGIGSIVGNGSTTSFNPSSDRRLKENIKPIENAIDKVMKLKPVTYNWINTGIADDGFIAQDLLELDDFKHRVNGIGKGEDGTEYYGVDYMRFVSILTAAIQELSKQNEELSNRLIKLESK